MSPLNAAVLLGLLWGAAVAQRPSPCPDIFRYEPREKGVVDKWTGIITITSDEELQGIWLRITLDQAANVLLNWFGNSQTEDNKNFVIRNSGYTLDEGAKLAVKIQVVYNALEIVPSVTSIRLNGRTVCRENGQTATMRPFISSVRTTTSTTTEIPIGIPIEVVTPTVVTRRTARPQVEEGNPGFFGGDFAAIPNTGIPQTRPHATPAGQTISCGTRAKKGTPLITHGQTAKEGDWPWHVALYYVNGLETRYICGGSLVSNSHVVTAAHCVTKPGTNRAALASGFVVHVGRTNLRLYGQYTQERELQTIIAHPKYNNTYYYNDVAVLKLSHAVEFTDFVRPVCLWTKELPSIVGELGTVVGWGFTEKHKVSEELQEAKMPVVDTLKCIYSNPEFFNKFTSPTSYCAGFRNGTSVCNGDSGGGMFFAMGNSQTWYLKGLVSVSLVYQGKYCDPNNYIVFTDLSNFTDWINQQMNL